MFIALLFVAQTTLALETTYPQVPGLPPLTDTSDLSDYVGYFFGLGCYLAGILAVISFAIGAIQIIMSASNPELQNTGKDRIRGSVLGLVLTLSAFIILKTINPQFVTPVLTPLPGVEGIYYARSAEELKAAPQSESNVSASQAVADGYNQIYYKCTDTDTAPVLLIWKFTNPGLESGNNLYTQVTVVRKECGDMEPIGNVGSFKMTFETPGIYYFLNEGCSGYRSTAYTTTQDKIPPPFTGSLRSVFINNLASDIYGAIFHSKQDPTKGSECTSPIVVGHNTTGAENTCFNLSEFSFAGFSAFSAEIFKYGLDPNSSSGDGVWFFSNVNGWNSGNKSGVAKVDAQQIGEFFLKKAELLKFDYTGVSTNLAEACKNNIICEDEEEEEDDDDDEDEEEPAEDCCFCSSPKDWNVKSTSTNQEYGCGGSIRFGGNNYLVTLYTIIYPNPDPDPEDPLENTRKYCQSFKEDVFNLSSGASFLPSGNHDLDYVNIIPIH